jgi:lactam utilization protein B
MKMRPEELTDCIIYQVGALRGFLEREGMTLFHVKPHGSLYGMAARLPEVAKAVADAATRSQGRDRGFDERQTDPRSRRLYLRAL